MSNLGELIYALPKEVKLEIRRLEKCFLKLQRKELSCAFNRTCLNEDILPKYTHIYIYDLTKRAIIIIIKSFFQPRKYNTI